MSPFLKILSIASLAALLCACGGSSGGTSMVAASNTHGRLAVDPPFRIASLNAASFKAELAGER